MENAPELTASNGGASEATSQASVIEFLAHPESYPDHAESVSRIDTHAALVFLTGGRAYKLKRAVKLPYLDFSTLEKRGLAIQRELDINSKTAPALYLGVLPVTRAPGRLGFEFAGSGEAVDWLLVMRRFEQEALLDWIASQGELGRGKAVELAYTIEHFHRQAERVRNAGFAHSLERVTADLATALCSQGAQTQGLRLDPYIGRLRQELEARLLLIHEREREGFVRRCHGDLHLRNIVMWEGRPRLFDAIEFDDKLATIDVLYDLAFLLMDLWHRGLSQDANVILNHYFQRAALKEFGGLALLPLFLSLRAAIRAMTGLHALAFLEPAGEENAVREVEGYASLAASLLEPGRPSLIAVGGISGTGKTSVARSAAPLIGTAPGALHIRTDVERKVMHGVALHQRLAREAYTAEARYEVYRRVFRKAETVLNTGHSVIVDAVFPDDASRASLREVAHRTNADFWGFWLAADVSVVQERLAARGVSSSDADSEIASAQLKTVEAPLNWIKIDASGPASLATAAVLRELGIKLPSGGAAPAAL